MVQTRLKLGRGEGQPRKHTHTPSYTKLLAQHQLPATHKKSAWIIKLFSSLSLAWLSSTYSIKRDFRETIKFLPAWCSLSPPPSASQLSKWQVVFVNLDTNTRLHATESCQRSLKQKICQQNYRYNCYIISPLNSVWLQYFFGLKYYLYSVLSLRGSHESNLNRSDRKQLIKMCRLLEICGCLKNTHRGNLSTSFAPE